MSFVETTDFTAFAKTSLSAIDYRGLHLVLVDHPLAGKPIKGKEGLLELTYGNFIVIYALSPSLMTIYLLQGYPRLAQPATGSPADQKAAADWLKTLRNGGIFAVGKKLTEFLWELVKNGLD